MPAESNTTPLPPAPAWWKVALEMRAPIEFAAGLSAFPLLAMSPRGDGHPVLVFPGLLASDVSTGPLRQLLRWLGHDVHGWQLGRNLGPRGDVLATSLARIRELARSSGRKVSLVGQSLGGIYARELAKQASDDVRCVITLGTPFGGGPRSTNAWQIFESLNGRGHLDPAARAALRSTPPVPTTSIYSRTDGIVAWECSVEQVSPEVENIEIEASHTGMAVNPLVLHAVADRLGQAEGHWQPYRGMSLRRAGRG